MKCQECGACCIALSISSEIPGMPGGKPAGIRCIHLDENNSCTIYYHPGRPAACAAYSPSRELCGGSFEEAMDNIALLERLTR